MTKKRLIKFLDLKELNKRYNQALSSSFNNFIESGWYVLGEQLKKFEDEYSFFSKTNYTIGVANGLDALVMSLKSLKICPGDEVIVPSNTYIATWLSISYCGAKPIPVEPNIETYNLDPKLIESKISKRTKAVMVVNLYGQSAELLEIKNICDKNNLYLIEDNAQSQGALCNGKLTGSFGIVNATSFYPGKNLGALGDAGAITTDDENINNYLRILRNYGSEKKYYNIIKGHNSRLDELQASILRIKLRDLKNQNTERQKIANLYNDGLNNIGDIVLPKIAEGCSSVFHLFVIRTKNRDKLINYLFDNKIETLIHYPIPPHLQNAYKDENYKKGDFPISELIADTALSLPVGPHLSEDDIGYICNKIKLFFKIK